MIRAVTVKVLMFTIFLGQIRRLVTGVVNGGLMMASTPAPGATCSSGPGREKLPQTDNPVALQRLTTVKGREGRRNDVVFCACQNSAKDNVVFFGGDVQDFTEKMEAHRDNKRWIDWNLESTALLLSRRFPHSHIWVVRPSKMHLGTFSSFINFVDSNDIGSPSHSEDYDGLDHLRILLNNAVDIVNKRISHQEAEVPCSSTCSADLPVTLIGFSKGCVVLNQLLYEFGAVSKSPDLKNFVNKIKRMYWLDGGHNGGSNTWIVHNDVIQNLKGLNIEIFSHVTPYQMKDSMRQWIGKEQKKFIQRLKDHGVKTTNKMHFELEEGSLDNHFQLLREF